MAANKNTSLVIPRATKSKNLPSLSQDKIRELVDAFFADKSAQTRRAYQGDLEDFRIFMGSSDIQEASKVMLSNGNGNANWMALKYRQNLASRGLAPATINRRLAALRSLVSLANTIGLVPWPLAIKSVKAKRYRDTAGPGKAAFMKMMQFAVNQLEPKRSRDVAILWLLGPGLALRRSETAYLTLSDVDLDRGLIAIKGKGRAEKEFLKITKHLSEALQNWIRVRGNAPGPMFPSITIDRCARGGVSSDGIHHIVQHIGLKVGVRVTPHGLRHTAITELCILAPKADMTYRDVQDFARHKDIKTTMIYFDRADSAQLRCADLLADAFVGTA